MKPVTAFSQEHIFPDRLGGALCSDLFKTRDVCERCNNVSGLFVDGAFIKSWFHSNDESMAALEYLDPRRPTSVCPLSYMGVLQGFELPHNEICEMWLGPCGVHYYHIHRRDDPRWDTFAGGDPIARSRDPGRVYVLLTTAQQDWVMLNLRIAMEYFPDARRYGGNIGLTTEPGAIEFLHQMGEAAGVEAARIMALPQMKQMTVPINIGFEQRFMAKLAFGLGYKIFGAPFLATDYAQRLREAMREKDYEKRVQLGLIGTGFLDADQDTTSRFVGWRGAYTIRLHAVSNRFHLSLHFPSTRAMHLTISDDPALWEGHKYDDYRQGVVFLVIPQLGEFVGPIGLPEYLTHRFGYHRIGALQRIEAQRVDPATLPSCR